MFCKLDSKDVWVSETETTKNAVALLNRKEQMDTWMAVRFYSFAIAIVALVVAAIAPVKIYILFLISVTCFFSGTGAIARFIVNRQELTWARAVIHEALNEGKAADTMLDTYILLHNELYNSRRKVLGDLLVGSPERYEGVMTNYVVECLHDQNQLLAATSGQETLYYHRKIVERAKAFVAKIMQDDTPDTVFMPDI